MLAKTFSLYPYYMENLILPKQDKRKRRKLRRFKLLFYEETRELYSPVISLLASSIPFAVADRIFKSFSLMPLSMVSS